MTISELVKNLQEIQGMYGDIETNVACYQKYYEQTCSCFPCYVSRDSGEYVCEADINELKDTGFSINDVELIAAIV